MAMKMKHKTRINYQNNCWKCEWCTNYYWPKREIGDRAHWRVDRKKIPSLERACRHWGRRFWRHYQWLCCVKRWSSTRSRTVSLATLKPPISQRGRPLIGGSTHLLWTQPYRMTASLLRTKSKNMNEVRDERRRRFWKFWGGGGGVGGVMTKLWWNSPGGGEKWEEDLRMKDFWSSFIIVSSSRINCYALVVCLVRCLSVWAILCYTETPNFIISENMLSVNRMVKYSQPAPTRR